MITKGNNKVYSDTLELQKLSLEPKLHSIFFNQNNQLLNIPKEIESLEYSELEDPVSLTAKITHSLFPNSTIIELVPIALSPNNHIITYTKILGPVQDIQIDTQIIEKIYTIELYNICKKRLSSTNNGTINETKASMKLGWRLILHRKIIKPIYYLFSNLIIKNIIIKYTRSLSLNHKSIICDIACGYDDLAIKIAKKYKSIAILNDTISKPIIKLANKKKYPNTLFINEDSLKLNLPHKADLLICKNVLHHLTSNEDIFRMLDKISELSNVLVIVDPENPKLTFLGRFWNLYYRRFLLDQGENFINYESFVKIISEYFNKEKIKIKKINTIKGPFMVAFIDKRN